MQRLAALLILSIVPSAASGAAQPLERALVACIENANPVPFLDRLFEAVGATQVAELARKYRRSAIVTDCRRADLEGALRRFRALDTDVVVLAHGTPQGIRLNDGMMSTVQIAALGRVSSRIRAVFQLNCWGARLAQAWLSAGARAVCGARGVNARVLAHENFLRAWTAGSRFRDAVAEANLARGLAQGLLRAAEGLLQVDSTFLVYGDGNLRF